MFNFYLFIFLSLGWADGSNQIKLTKFITKFTSTMRSPIFILVFDI